MATTAINSTDLLAGEIYNESNREHAQNMFASTPSYGAEILNPILAETPEKLRNRRLHLGDGVWVAFCSECDAHVRSWGSVLLVRPLTDHLWEDHGVSQGPLLP